MTIKPRVLTYRDGDPFPGRIGSTFEDSAPAWPVGPRAPKGSPNVLLVVLDDVGYAQLGCFGFDIATPTFDALAAGGLRYRSFHTTAMCSPTRACLATGRNHHTCAMGGITDLAMGFPGYHGRIPKSCGFTREVLRQAGWATLAVGKWHLAPSDELHAAASRDRWPLGQGFERYYGFIGAETNQWTPDLAIDNRLIRFDPPPGYHLTEDLVNQAVTMLAELQAADPANSSLTSSRPGACFTPRPSPTRASGSRTPTPGRSSGTWWCPARPTRTSSTTAPGRSAGPGLRDAVGGHWSPPLGCHGASGFSKRARLSMASPYPSRSCIWRRRYSVKSNRV